MSFLIDHVSKGFGSGSDYCEVLLDIQLEIPENEFLAIVGFSGSGKSTLINLMAGLEVPERGSILLDGTSIRGPGPDRGVVFQNYSLLPWLTVGANVELAVRQVFPKMNRVERREHVEKYIDMVNLLPAMWKRPKELSGGMRQRVSLARTLAMQPRILLLDEPLGALDALTRAVLQDELLQIWEKEKKTVVMITNDVDEAILLADRIIPLNPGPRATLGPDFRVDLARPRDRATMNTDPAFKKIRNGVTQYLMKVNDESKNLGQRPKVICPDIDPIDLNRRVS